MGTEAASVLGTFNCYVGAGHRKQYKIISRADVFNAIGFGGLGNRMETGVLGIIGLALFDWKMLVALCSNELQCTLCALLLLVILPTGKHNDRGTQQEQPKIRPKNSLTLCRKHFEKQFFSGRPGLCARWTMVRHWNFFLFSLRLPLFWQNQKRNILEKNTMVLKEENIFWVQKNAHFVCRSFLGSINCASPGQQVTGAHTHQLPKNLYFLPAGH